MGSKHFTLLHQIAFTAETFDTKEFLHQKVHHTPFTPEVLNSTGFENNFTPAIEAFYTKTFARKVFTPQAFYTRMFAHVLTLTTPIFFFYSMRRLSHRKPFTSEALLCYDDASLGSRCKANQEHGAPA